MKKLLHRHFAITFILTLLTITPVLAGKIDAMFGYYSLTAKSSRSSGAISGLGSYKIGYFQNFYKNFEAGVGYTVIMSDIVGGDMEYGLDIAINYFPVSSSSTKVFNNTDMSVKVYDLWRPYVGAGFAQRQIQSVKVSYAGFALQGGVERRVDGALSLKSELRMVSLVGETQGEATEVNMFVGLSFSW